MSNKVLVVEDENKLAGVLKDYLEQSGFIVRMIDDGALVMGVLSEFQANIVLLDIMLPNKDGITLCKEIRQSPAHQYLPVIMTTAKVEEIDRLLGLEIGADDYICKPYSPREVVARVKAIWRRQQFSNTPEASSGLILDDEKMMVQLHGEKVDLTAVEYTLLSLLAKSPGRIYSRAQLMEEIYSDYRVVSERTIDSHIKKLRQKIAKVNDTVEVVHSVYGVGYKMEYVEVE
ncbi:MAG: response regulator [Cellvibrionaceae bacterium]